MILIGNMCSTAFAQQKLGIKYTSPFVWCFIKTDDFIKLIDNFYDIDFEDTKFNLINRPGFNIRCVQATIQDDIKASFVHYMQTNGKERDVAGDIYRHDIIGYAKEKWINRAARMKQTVAAGEKPCFVYCFSRCFSAIAQNLLKATDEQLQYLANTGRCNLATSSRHCDDDVVHTFNKYDKTIRADDIILTNVWSAIGTEIAQCVREQRL